MPISKMRNDTFKGQFIDTGMHQSQASGLPTAGSPETPP